MFFFLMWQIPELSSPPLSHLYFQSLSRLRSRPRSCSRPRCRPVSAPVTALVSVSVPIHFPSLRSFFRFRPRSCFRPPSRSQSRFRLTLVISPPTLLPFVLPLHACVHRCPRPSLRFRSLISVPRAWLPSRYNSPAQSPAFVNRATGAPLTPLPVCRDDDACGIKVPPVQQKRIVAENVLLSIPPPDPGTCSSVSSTCVLPIWLRIL